MTLLLSLLLALPLSAGEPQLSFQKSGKEVRNLTLPQLKAAVKPVHETLFDPHHGKVKSYDCLPITDVMEAGFGKDWQRSPNTEAVLTAMDGYASVAKAAKLAEEGGCLAYSDGGEGGWEPVGRKKADPGPFYLVWKGEAQSAANEYPWPWQLMSINLVRFEERYPELVPRGVKEGAPAYRGYLTFRGQCLRCHSINQQGGKIGPDLNAPQSIVQYRSKEMLLSFIRKPSQYRYSEMPDHPHLTDRDLEDLYEYFKVKSAQPEKSW